VNASPERRRRERAELYRLLNKLKETLGVI